MHFFYVGLRDNTLSSSPIRCLLVRPGPFSVLEFAPDLPPNSSERRENPASWTGLRTAVLALVRGSGRGRLILTEPVSKTNGGGFDGEY